MDNSDAEVLKAVLVSLLTHSWFTEVQIGSSLIETTVCIIATWWHDCCLISEYVHWGATQPRISPPGYLPFLSVNIHPDETSASLTVPGIPDSGGNCLQSHSNRATTEKKKTKKTKTQTQKNSIEHFSLSPCTLFSSWYNSNLTHKNNQRVRWWGQDYFNSSLCNHSEALSQSENLSEYSASQQPSQKQQRLKLPSSLLALHLSHREEHQHKEL